MSAMTLLEQAEYQLALSKAQAREAEMRDKFHSLDRDRSGFIERSELRPLLLELGFIEADTNQGFERFLAEEFKRAALIVRTWRDRARRCVCRPPGRCVH